MQISLDHLILFDKYKDSYLPESKKYRYQVSQPQKNTMPSLLKLEIT